MGGYFTGYRTGYATGYMPGAEPEPTAAVASLSVGAGSGYCTGYRTGYCTGYMPGSVGAPAVPTDLVDAVEALVEREFVATGLLAWAGAGAIPPRQAMPFARLGPLDEEAEYQEDGSGHAPYDDLGTFPVMVAASIGSRAKSLALAISQARPDAPLELGDGGDLLTFRRINKVSPVLEDEDAAEGQRTWIAHLMFHTIVSRYL